MTPIVIAGDCRWNYLDTGGSTRPVIVLFHGFTGSAEVWNEAISQLHRDFRCVAVDLPGHGATEYPPDIVQFQLPVVADRLAEFFDDLGLPPLILWGYSMGGRLALQYALRHPQTLTHLVLESASPGLADEEERQQRRNRDDALADHVLDIGIGAFVNEWERNPLFDGQHRLSDAKRERMHQIRLRNTPERLALSLRGMGTGAQPPLHDQLSQLNVPTLIMTGEDDRKFSDIGRGMCASLPDARIRYIGQAGHSPYWEQPEATVACVREFLQSTTA